MKRRDRVLLAICVAALAVGVLIFIGSQLDAHRNGGATQAPTTSQQMFQAELYCDLCDNLMETGAVSAWRLEDSSKHLVLTAKDGWYSLPYHTKKDLVGTAYLGFVGIRHRCGWTDDFSVAAYVVDQWGEVLAECKGPQEVKVYR